MLTIPFHQVDAFTSTVFSGNPAGVCLLEDWLPDDVLRSVAAENNLPETAFLVDRGTRYALRWFTPEMEIDLCGHATLASGHVIFESVDPALRHVEFESKSGVLAVERRGDLLVLDFPSRKPRACAAPDVLGTALGQVPCEVLAARDLMAVYHDERVIAQMDPDFTALAQLEGFAVIVTAPGRDCDFVSRFFAPRAGIPEDPVTGSAHCTLIPYWAERLGKPELYARQLSKRGGELFCSDKGERVSIGGHAVTYLSGRITV